MSDMVPSNGAGPQAPLDLTVTVKEDVQALVVWACEVARESQDGGEFNKYATGISALMVALQPKPAPGGPAGSNGSAQKGGSGGAADQKKPTV